MSNVQRSDRPSKSDPHMFQSHETMYQAHAAPLFPAAKVSSGVDSVTILQQNLNAISLSARFAEVDDDYSPELVIEDNISIAIQRKGPNMYHDPSRPIRRSFESGDELVLKRRKNEGRTPIFAREEILKFGHDKILDDEIFEERRTISVQSTDDEYSSRDKNR